MKNKVIFGKPDIRTQDVIAVKEVLKSGWIGMGGVTQLLEQAFSKFTGAKYAVAVSSGSAGLFLSLLACGIGKGDEVITSPMTFPATANEILHTGAKVRFVDIDETGNIDTDKIEQAITKKTKAILPVHLYGRPCNMNRIIEIARAYRLLIIEDAAHAFGAVYKNKHIGNIGDATVFSLYATKNITAGEGGVVTTNNKAIADKIRLLRSYGITRNAWSRFTKKNNSKPYDTVLPGYNFEIPDILAALALSQINTFKERFERRRYIWQVYNQAFEGLNIGLPFPVCDNASIHAMHLYTIMVDKRRAGIDRKDFIKKLDKMGIGTGIHFISLHLHSFYKKLYNLKNTDFPVALSFSEQTLSLPLSSGMTDRDINRVVIAVRRVCNG
ncbi:MAG: DegT/DnrJ/EryC1/StrS family aminotransferase [bacterium]